MADMWLADVVHDIEDGEESFVAGKLDAAVNVERADGAGAVAAGLARGEAQARARLVLSSLAATPVRGQRSTRGVGQVKSGRSGTPLRPWSFFVASTWWIWVRFVSNPTAAAAM